MLYLEPLIDNILASEGQIFLGLDYIADSLGLTVKKMEGIFKTCILQYGRRRPIEITRDFTSSSIIQLPSNTLGIKSIRWGILPEYPRFFQQAWDEITYEFNMSNKTLKVFPPNTQVKVTYVAYPTLVNSQEVQESFFTVPNETTYQDIMQNSYRQGTLKILKGTLTMSEISRTPETITLGGTLGTGTINIASRELELNLVNNTEGGEVILSYYPKYLCCPELDMGDYIFYKLFALNILRSIASLKAQNTQDDLHNIDLTVDSLQDRVRELEREVTALLRKTISFGGMGQI